MKKTTKKLKKAQKYYNELIPINTKTLVLVRSAKDNKIKAHYYIEK